MKFHIYGTKGFGRLSKGSGVKDLRAIAHFNKIIKNYLKMTAIKKKTEK